MPRGWREGRPPPTRPRLPEREYNQFQKKKLEYYIRLKARGQTRVRKLRLCDLRDFHFDDALNYRVFSEEEIKSLQKHGTSYERSFKTLSSHPGGGRSKCIVLESGYNPLDHFFVTHGDNLDSITPVNEIEYRSQFLEGDDSDYDILRFQPILADPEEDQHNERALVPAADENGAEGVADTVGQEAAAATIGDSVANASGGQGDSVLRFQPILADPEEDQHNERALVPAADENGAEGVADTVGQEAAAATIGDSVANASGGQGDSAASGEMGNNAIANASGGQGGRMDLEAAAATVGDSVANASGRQGDSALSGEMGNTIANASGGQGGRVDSLPIGEWDMPISLFVANASGGQGGRVDYAVGGPMHPIDIDDDDNNNSERGAVSGIDPGLYDNDMNLDDYTGLLDRLGTGTERQGRGASNHEIARMGKVIPTQGTCPICSKPCNSTENVRFGGNYLFHEKCMNETKRLMDPEKCSICLEEFNGCNAKVLSCGHIFHQECVDQSMSIDARCPNCRAPQKRFH